MSKLLDATITCPQCGKQYPVKLFRTLWGEHEELRNKVMNNEVNVCTCPHCSFSFKAPFAFMYVDVVKGFAVWWEPVHDEGIDADQQGYTKIFGANSFYAQAPRIADWDEFKKVINEYYTGVKVGSPIQKMDFSSLKKKPQNKNGCLGLILLAIVLSTVFFI